MKNLKEETQINSAEPGFTAVITDLINKEYELLSEYDSAQVTFEAHNENRFSEIFEYIADDINIHIGMLQACLEDLNPASEKIADGKEQAEDMI